MSNPQRVKFRSINDFLDYLPKEELQIVERLQTIVLDTLPDVRERLAYNVPFYYRRRRLAYVWPASVPWGAVERGVALGFSYGKHLSYFADQRTGTTTKLVFTELHQIDTPLLEALLLEAAEWDKNR